MKHYFGYTRVSTVKQGDGVSLKAQRDAIEVYAHKHRLAISDWFEEKETAAKRGRPLFSAMMKSLRNGRAAGVIIHKIDRSARNYTDWAAINELLDDGVDVRFVHESLDLTSRGGRITADIQAVIAADYVRNLREECLKGIEGRLKQGLFPFSAPLGYLDQGAGKPKTPDPERAPFVRQTFELYGSQQYSIRTLLVEINRRGFRNRRGNPITKGCLENLLSNPFYTGIILMKRTGRVYAGKHKPLIEQTLFDRVQALKAGKYIKKSTTHNHTYRRLIQCGLCGRSLCGEVQKGRVYMRCQTKGCPTTTIREDRLEAEISHKLLNVTITDHDQRRLEQAMHRWLRKRNKEADRRALELQLSNLALREEQLTDALLDGLIDKPAFTSRRQRLEGERMTLATAIEQIGETARDLRLAEHYLELAKSVHLTYLSADRTHKRRLAETLLSNRVLTAEKLCLATQKWLHDKNWTLSVLCGPPDRDNTRTKEDLRAILREFLYCDMQDESD